MWKCEGLDLSNHLLLEESDVNNLAELIIGTGRIRYGSRPSAENYDHLVSTLDARLTNNEPIEFLVMWGATKAYGHFELHTTDLLDLMALKRLWCLSEAIKRTHAPGIRVKIIWEDLTTLLTTGTDCMDYLNSFRALIDAMGLHFIEVILESDLADCPAYIRDIYINAEAIENGREAEVGWRGPVLWDYFLKRAASKYPTASAEYLRDRVALYLGICMARYQYKVLPPSDVKLSFAPYPKEVPDSMRRGRVEYKLKADKSNGSTTPPWCGFGVLRASDWTHISGRQFATGSYRANLVLLNGAQVIVLEAAA